MCLWKSAERQVKTGVWGFLSGSPHQSAQMDRPGEQTNHSDVSSPEKETEPSSGTACRWTEGQQQSSELSCGEAWPGSSWKTVKAAGGWATEIQQLCWFVMYLPQDPLKLVGDAIVCPPATFFFAGLFAAAGNSSSSSWPSVSGLNAAISLESSSSPV